MDSKILLIIFGMGLVTYIPRMIPLVILSKFDMPPLFLKWLKYIPVAVLSALLLPGILITEQGFSMGLNNKSFLASLPCFFVAAKTRNLFITVLVGIVSMFILQRIL
ncbi:MAG: AzlD domain-containing protein [Clostridiaceae bacterium]|nr:AzlD domain-containing protein [Clostridiaceae bacterium]